MIESIVSQRTAILDEMAKQLRAWPIPQVDKAHRLALTEAELVDLLAGKADEFSLEQLRFIGRLAGLPAGKFDQMHRASAPASRVSH
jgi:hypothetical protein